MEAPDFLPLGSVCRVKGSDKRLMIIARGLALLQEGQEYYYDYGSCLYPEGMMRDEAVYFNHETIEEVYWEGFDDKENKVFCQLIKTSLEQLDIPKGNPAPLEAQTSEPVKEETDGFQLN